MSRPFDHPRGLVRFIASTACLALLAAAVGCHEDELGYYEVKRIDEPITAGDYADLLAVLVQIGESERARLTPPFIAPPRWPADRTLPVGELLAEERAASAHAWEPESAAAALPDTPQWEKALKSRKLTRAQFASLVLTAAAAIGAAEADPRLDLSSLAARGGREIAPLNREERTFASLSEEERYAILDRAAWLTTADRAARLSRVPPENVELVVSREAELRKLLPAGFFEDPFAGLYPRPRDFGVPFEEAGSSDVELSWSPAWAVVGHDAPDVRSTADKTPPRH